LHSPPIHQASRKRSNAAGAAQRQSASDSRIGIPSFPSRPTSRKREPNFKEFAVNLYPALQRLERRGWIKARWGTSENNRRAKYYDLTKVGRKQLATELDSWHKLAAAVAQVLGPA
jgi:Transcriptional regulator PadR-like family